ncbi:hypothetical protein FGB62_248g015 [Gracilaria domingensis]|nr:hypothetical protein FGB62_248g015 [Gracilaria domingensis]
MSPWPPVIWPMFCDEFSVLHDPDLSYFSPLNISAKHVFTMVTDNDTAHREESLLRYSVINHKAQKVNSDLVGTEEGEKRHSANDEKKVKIEIAEYELVLYHLFSSKAKQAVDIYESIRSLLALFARGLGFGVTLSAQTRHLNCRSRVVP